MIMTASEKEEKRSAHRERLANQAIRKKGGY